MTVVTMTPGHKNKPKAKRFSCHLLQRNYLMNMILQRLIFHCIINCSVILQKVPFVNQHWSFPNQKFKPNLSLLELRYVRQVTLLQLRIVCLLHLFKNTLWDTCLTVTYPLQKLKKHIRILLVMGTISLIRLVITSNFHQQIRNLYLTLLKPLQFQYTRSLCHSRETLSKMDRLRWVTLH